MVCKCGEKLKEAGKATWAEIKLFGCLSCDSLWEEHKEGRRESLVKLSTWEEYKKGRV